nr:MAG TPA: hypothetical protein [Caudoviricetes sp.]
MFLPYCNNLLVRYCKSTKSPPRKIMRLFF